MNTLVSVQQLQKSFGGRIALDIPFFELSSNDSLAVIGPNGAGKTTFLGYFLDYILQIPLLSSMY